MASRRPPGLPDFLSTLAAFPDPTRLLADLIAGPLASLGALSAALWVGEPDAIRLVAADGMRPTTMTELAHISVDDDGPIIRSFLESEVIFDDAGLITERTPSSMPGTARNGGRNQREVHGLVCLPIVSLGISIGVVAVCTSRPPRLTTLEIAQLDGVSAALGLWLTHPDSGIATHDAAVDDEVPSLTERQMQIVSLIRKGRSNSAIAAQLGISVSTVKQDIQRVQRRLRTGSRIEMAQRANALGLVPEPSST